MKKTPVGLQKTFPIYHAYSTYQDHDKVEITPVDWERGIVHCVLTQHP